ncbi:MAG: response regulator [Flavobacterium sp.]|uniref:Response regulator transcription factor n=1 Tax=Flavobacterium celericrescens TaxID=2709780 RepID=A0ABX0IB83_9FLAO|nr:response regulator [Flavobacterium celericrescens]NHM04425.1 response regulator transcription factor [Flavobacterium celericrescens]
MKKKASKILLIEDDISLGQTVSELLEVNDYEVKWCQNGLEAYHYLETKMPDIIVCDLMMPIMSGEELFFKIRKLKKYDEIPFLIITADMTFETKLKQLENGVNDFINKPFKIQELIFKIKNFLQYKETLMKRTIQDPFSKVTIKLKNKNFFERLNEVIIKNIKSNITIEKIASELFISKSALDKKIRRDKQVNTTKYIREFRIEYAIRLIEAGETNVQQLADSCGFNSLSYFSISFKEYTNTSPKSYIKKRNLN